MMDTADAIAITAIPGNNLSSLSTDNGIDAKPITITATKAIAATIIDASFLSIFNFLPPLFAKTFVLSLLLSLS